MLLCLRRNTTTNTHFTVRPPPLNLHCRHRNTLMAETSISSQLQAIKTVLNASSDPEPGKRCPITRPSISYEGKVAADIDLDTILLNALSGLEVLINLEERFRNYKNDLFNEQSKEVDKELLDQDENNRINASISSYLRYYLDILTRTLL